MARPKIIQKLALMFLREICRRDSLWNIYNLTIQRGLMFLGRRSKSIASLPFVHMLLADPWKMQSKKVISGHIKERFPDLTVRYGIFAGLKLHESALEKNCIFAKLIGSYESEVSFFIEEISRVPYDAIVNIGCGEGYYLGGIALMFPSSKLYGFDTDQKTQELCQATINLNDLSDRVIISGSCDAQRAIDLVSSYEKVLIVSDCESYEMELFSEATVNSFAHVDLLIETHEFLQRGCVEKLKRIFRSTHAIREIKSMSDIRKTLLSQHEELDDLNLLTKRLLLSELRPETMHWLCLKSLAIKN